MAQQRISDSEVQSLVGVAQSIEPQYVYLEQEWKGSPFGWIKHQPSRRRGTILEQLIEGWCRTNSFNVASSPNSDSDRVIGGLRVEIKGSTLWASGGFKFQQLRNQAYDIVICLGISPFDAQCWVIPKSVLFAHPRPEGVTPQHGGRAGRDTWWLCFQASSPPQWLRQWGGRLAEANQVLHDLTGS